jgi:hypothetical protein
MHPEYTPQEIERFWSKVDRSAGPDACWLWTGTRIPQGYGTLSLRRSPVYAHRFAFIITNGWPAEKMCVCHACDNPSCCNPAHLWLGTHTDNMRDMLKKGRRTEARGENVSTAKLTEDQVREIRATRLYRGAISDMMRRYGVSRTALTQLLRGNTWKHLL